MGRRCIAAPPLGVVICAVAGARSTTTDVPAIQVNSKTIATPEGIGQNQSPFAQARLLSITQLAVFEAVNAITHTYQPYLGTVDAPDGASADAAAVTAA